MVGREIEAGYFLFDDNAIFYMRKKAIGYTIIVNTEYDAERLFKTNSKFVIDIRNIFSFFGNRGDNDGIDETYGGFFKINFS